MAKTLMIQGTSSNVGKTAIAAVLCRVYARRGIRAAPFKAKNMALNSYVSPDGLELGRSQALAARIEPDVRMNPVLLKPQKGGSQNVCMGRPLKKAARSDHFSNGSGGGFGNSSGRG